MVIPERESVAVIEGEEAKNNTPVRLILRVLWKPCACGEGYVGRSPGNDVWSRAEQIKGE